MTARGAIVVSLAGSLLLGSAILLSTPAFAYGAHHGTPAPHRSTVPPPATHFGQNLVLNPGGEDGLGAADELHVVKPSRWDTDGGFTVVQYGAHGYLPTQGTSLATPPPPPPRLGKNLFAGGPGSIDKASAWQPIPLWWAAKDIKRGNVPYELSAWLGGWYTQEDSARLALRFFDRHGRSLCRGNECATLGPVTRSDRYGQTTLLQKQCSGIVPSDAYKAEVRIEAYRFSGDYNDGYADDVSFVVRPAHRSATRCTVTAYDRNNRARSTATLNQVSNNCSRWNASILGVLLAFLVGNLLAITTRRRGPLAASRSKRWSIAGAGAIGVFIASFFGFPKLVLDFQFGDLGCLNQPWVAPSLLFGGMLAAISIMLAIIFVMRYPTWTRGFDLWEKLCILADIGIFAVSMAFVGLGAKPPTEDDLNAMDASLLICSVVMVYALMAFGRTVARRIPRLVRVGLFLIFLAPAYQPLEASWKFAAIQRDRLAFEHEHTILQLTAPKIRYDNIVFEAPTSLDFSQSARVLFSARRSLPYTGNGCLAPRFVAPGFDIDGVLDEPVRLDHETVTWEWIVTPKRSGRQYAFVSVLYSADCSPFSQTPADAASGATKKATTGEPQGGQSGLDPVFTAEDSTWISRQFFSLENLNAVSSSLTAVVGIVSIVFGVFGLPKLAGGADGKPPEEGGADGKPPEEGGADGKRPEDGPTNPDA